MSKELRNGARVAVVGATGAVGREIIRCLHVLSFPIAGLYLLASPRSAGTELDTPYGRIRVLDAGSFDFGLVDIALCSAGAAVSRALADRIVADGVLMIDNTSAFRRDPAWPLVVPEINGDLIRMAPGIIANPNCSTIQMVLALDAIRGVAGLRSVRVATYQSCSGAGHKGMDALRRETSLALQGDRPVQSDVHARGIAFDCVPQIGAFAPSGFSEEEEKMMFETRKILGMPDLPVSATCVRVPVFRSHSEVVHVVTERGFGLGDVLAALDGAPGLKVTDAGDVSRYPTAVQAEGRFETLVGRVRRDPCDPNGLILWIVSDNLLKGAALNAVQIALAAWQRGSNG